MWTWIVTPLLVLFTNVSTSLEIFAGVSAVTCHINTDNPNTWDPLRYASHVNVNLLMNWCCLPSVVGIILNFDFHMMMRKMFASNRNIHWKVRKWLSSWAGPSDHQERPISMARAPDGHHQDLWQLTGAAQPCSATESWALSTLLKLSRTFSNVENMKNSQELNFS